jgi:regulatory protein
MVELKPVDVRRAAMDFLARREHSFQELVGKLNRKFISRDELHSERIQDLILDQVKQLSQENLQSDQRYVESFINGRKSQGKGPLRISQELERKGISADLIEDFLQPDDGFWLELAEQVYIKKFGHQEVADYQDKTKRMRFMQYRGFSYFHINDLVK